MLAVIPSPKSQVKPPYKGYCLVNGHHLLMVSPQKHHRRHVVRMPHHLTDQWVKLVLKCAFRALLTVICVPPLLLLYKTLCREVKDLDVWVHIH